MSKLSVKGHLSAELYGYMLSPFEPHLIQGNKMESPHDRERSGKSSGNRRLHNRRNATQRLYIVGPGTTTRTVGDLFDQKKTLLGVDLFEDKKIIAKDVNEKQILQAIKRQTHQNHRDADWWARLHLRQRQPANQ